MLSLTKEYHFNILLKDFNVNIIIKMIIKSQLDLFQ